MTPSITVLDRVALLVRALVSPIVVLVIGVRIDMPAELLLIVLFGSLVLSGSVALDHFEFERRRRTRQWLRRLAMHPLDERRNRLRRLLSEPSS